MKKFYLLLVLCLLYHVGYSQTWKNLDSLPTGVNFARTGAFSINGKGYVFGAFYETKAWSYDTLTNAWSQISDYPASTTDGVVGCSLNGIGYAGTGVQYSTFSNNFFKYDPVTGNWSALPDFPGAGRGYAVAFALDGKVYIGGGFSQGSIANMDFYAYDPVVGTWGSAIAPCPALGVACSAVAFVVGDKAYVGTGGMINSSIQAVPQKDFWEYDTISKVWTRIADLPGSVRAEASAFSTCDKGFVGLGYTDVARDSNAIDFWQYNPEKDNWTSIGDYKGDARSAAFSFSIGKTGYVGGGFLSTGANNFHDLWSYTETVTPAFTASSNSICAGQSVTFTDTSNYAPTNRQWIFPGGIPRSSTAQNPVIEYDTAGTYDVIFSAWNGCDSGEKTFSQYITVGAGGALSITANPNVICSGQSATLTIISGAGTYKWLPATGLSDSTSATVSASPTITTTYTVTAFGGGGCASAGQVVLTVGNNAIAGTITALRDTICQGESGNLTLTGNSNSSIQWQSSVNNINFTNLPGDTLANFITDSLKQTTWFKAIVGSGNCSAVSDTLELYVPPMPLAIINAADSATTVTFNADVYSGDIRSYSWDFGDGQTATIANPIHTYDSAGIYRVCLSITSVDGCQSEECTNVIVNVADKCLAYFGLYPDNNSPHHWFILNQSKGDAPINYLWSWGDGNTSTGPTPSYTYASAGSCNICLNITDDTLCTSNLCDSALSLFRLEGNTQIYIDVVTSLPTGITNIAGNEQLMVYPNPFSNELTIALGEAGSSKQLAKSSKIQSIVMYDVLGRVVVNAEIGNSTNTSFQLDVSSLAKGMYYVMIKTANADYVQKVVKQ